MVDGLIEAAEQAQRQAYAPYSRFRVGAAVEAEDGSVFTGCNVENASYGLVMCAERVAIGAAGGSESLTTAMRRKRRTPAATAAPCGACRQVIFEFAPDAEVLAKGPRSSHRWTMRELLPAAFSGSQLT